MCDVATASADSKLASNMLARLERLRSHLAVPDPPCCLQASTTT